MKFIVSPAATDDILSSIDWHIEHRHYSAASGLFKAWEIALQKIKEQPTRYPQFDTNLTKMEIREFLIRKYRLRLLYEVRETEVEVLAAVSTWFDETTITSRLNFPNG